MACHVVIVEWTSIKFSPSGAELDGNAVPLPRLNLMAILFPSGADIGGSYADGGGDVVAVPEGYGFVGNRVESEARALCPDRQLPHGQVCRR